MVFSVTYRAIEVRTVSIAACKAASKASVDGKLVGFSGRAQPCGQILARVKNCGRQWPRRQFLSKEGRRPSPAADWLASRTESKRWLAFFLEEQ